MQVNSVTNKPRNYNILEDKLKNAAQQWQRLGAIIFDTVSFLNFYYSTIPKITRKILEIKQNTSNYQSQLNVSISANIPP